MRASSNAALSYSGNTLDPGDRPMGRHAAGQGMLRGFVEHAGVSAIYGFGETEQDKSRFEAAVRSFGGAVPIHWSDRADFASIKLVGALHLSGPPADSMAFHRRAVDQRAWSLTGVTHTVSSHVALAAIASMATGPFQSWDALVCTSRAVKAVVVNVLDEQADYLEDRLGARATPCPVQLPIIPLGVSCSDFAAEPHARHTIRARLGLPDEAVLVLHAARLSFHAKAHPHPLYVSLQRAAERTGEKVHLLLASWFSSAYQERVFREGAAELCPDVTLHFIDGREEGAWTAVWQAGDIYTLLSDNIQESFGISPVEAMAAGIPVVGSDWNGLRDTIVHGETGFLAPTLAPPPGAGAVAASAYDLGQIDYDAYIGATAQPVSVDITAAADAFAALISDVALRRRMGEAGRARAAAQYDWRQIVPQYQTLWAELAERRQIDAELAPVRRGRGGTPGRTDPYRMFEG